VRCSASPDGRRLEVCQRFDTLIGDEQCLYTMSSLDDALVLGIKGTLSVVELRVLRRRVDEGKRNQARRGEFYGLLLAGDVLDGGGKPLKDPDARVREAIELALAGPVLPRLFQRMLHDMWMTRPLTVALLAHGLTACFAPVEERPDVAFETGSAAGAGGAGSGSGEETGGSGQWLAFDSDRAGGNRDLWVMKEGGQPKRLTTEPSTDMEPAFSADGTQLAFASDRVGMQFQLFVMKLSDRSVRQVTTLPGAVEPAWSPDGSELAFRRGASVFRIPVTGGPEVLVLTGPDERNGFKNPVYTLDGKRLIIDRGNEVSTANLNGGDRRFIVNNTTTTIVHPSLSPDGVNVACAIWCTGGTSIWVFPFDGIAEACRSGAVEVAPAETSKPAWGARQLAWERGSPADIMLGLPVARTAATNLTNHPADDRNPAWAPVGTSIP
jgi:hypothetical protein